MVGEAIARATGVDDEHPSPRRPSMRAADNLAAPPPTTIASHVDEEAEVVVPPVQKTALGIASDLAESVSTVGARM